MSYIAFELDALNKAPAVARAARVSEDSIIGGLARMWAYAFREQADTLSRLQVAGFFDVEADVVPALMAFGFIEEAMEGFRVRGADRYKRVSDARRKGAEKTNAAKRERAVERRSSDAQATLKSVDERALNDALTPSTEHRAPNTESKAEEAPPPKTLALAAFAIEGPDPERMESWSAQEFWKAFELERRQCGYPPEKWPPPNSLRDWWTEARSAFDVRVLGMAASNYYRDEHWKAARPSCPWAGFAKQWHKYLPRKAVAS